MKSVKAKTLLDYLNDVLVSEQFQDYAPNGLQVEGIGDIKHIVTGVSACQALIDAAIAVDADAILVHHGYFWKGETPCLLGIKRQRLACLLNQDIHLFAYHLPLDAHPTLGNNTRLAAHLGWEPAAREPSDRHDLIWYGHTPEALTPLAFAEQLNLKLARPPLHIAGQSSHIHKIAWCTGAAQDYFEKALAAGIDAFITGEVSERTWHIAKEYGVHFYAAGHHATERYGIQALGQHIADTFGIKHSFIDIPNPI